MGRVKQGQGKSQYMGTLSNGTLLWAILLEPSKEQYEIYPRVVYPQTEKWECLSISLSSTHQGLPYGFLTSVLSGLHLC